MVGKEEFVEGANGPLDAITFSLSMPVFCTQSAAIRVNLPIRFILVEGVGSPFQIVQTTLTP